jgi:hypothetical protein
MSVSGILSSSLTQLTGSNSDNNMSKMKQAWQQLGQDLQSGDLSGAQSAFQTIQQLRPQQSGSSGSQAQGSSQLSSDMQALGEALSSGNLSSAQSAFASVQNDMKSMHHHHSGGSSQSSQSSSSSVEDILDLLNSSSASSSSSSTSATTADQTLAELLGQSNVSVQA